MRWRLAAALLVLLVPVSASAQGWLEFLPRRQPLPEPMRVERVRTSVTVRVTDRIARVEVEEWFRNTGAGVAEGDYVYPLAGEAVFSDFSLFQGEEELKGETMDATRARSIYEDIVRRRKDPALIELAGHGLIRARVFPFGPGETRNVRLLYTQVLERTGDAVRYRYATGRPRSWTRPAPARFAVPDAPVTFTLVSDTGGRFGDPFSPTHDVRVSRDGGKLTVRPSSAAPLTGDFDIFLPLAGEAVGISLATHRVDDESGYFMLTLSPAAVKAAAAQPRDVAVVVDTSGSMSGEKMEQARQALRQLLGTFAPADRFRLVSFNSGVSAQSAGWSPASRANVDAARTWVDGLSARGGTNISGALDEAFRTPGEEGRLHMVIFITDGLPTDGMTDPDRIAARVEASRGNARIFTFGVGHDVHVTLLESMAQAGRGTVDYVEPGRAVEDAVGDLANRIRLPVLVDLRLAGSPAKLRDMQPSELPDVYAGQEMVVFGRYDAPSSVTGELAITGSRGGRAERHAARVEFPAREASGSYIPGLWASRKIGDLMRTIRLEGSTPEREAEVRELGLRYGVLTEYTAYLVREPAGPTARMMAPEAFTGEAVVALARAAASQRLAQSFAQVAMAEAPIVDRLSARSGAGARVVAGRAFTNDGTAWIDQAYKPGAPVVDVGLFSQAYFDVLARLPEVKPYLSTFDAVTVAGRAVSIRFVAGGAATLSAQRLDALVRDFRRP